MIQLFNVVKNYGGGKPALDDVSLTIEKGEFVFLTGPSGAGKSTILKTLFGWEPFESGQILVQGINVGRLDTRNIHTLRRSMGVIFQDYKLLQNKTVFENVAFALEVTNRDRKTIKFKTWEALKNVGLTPKKDALPAQLSGGEQQRVAIARAMVNAPPIILADEPTGNLDQEISYEILKLFEEMNRNGATIVFATHSQEILRPGKHRVIVLNRGKVVAS
ncbi:MAG: cell division ATP-binding protein FtsE [Nitrospinaceae bacterium]|jgi:cell division transport system ATP-binding protein|nr:cell division ATP-binding protein FtsE [Nitrospina sp.]MBT5376727.1 cell division ATP-binding protein FtsE [Nitrospinaceae bacterium]MBT5868042.1 cell division ATP-binding protein FtsE [Nitrospinaceae bacterium]MBT6346680.1 cell division ATP-binding protein FtsE [Nitrospina sp.]